MEDPERERKPIICGRVATWKIAIHGEAPKLIHACSICFRVPAKLWFDFACLKRWDFELSPIAPKEDVTCNLPRQPNCDE